MPAFLTEDWFATVEKLTAEAGDTKLTVKRIELLIPRAIVVT